MDKFNLIHNDGQIPCSSCGAITYFIDRNLLCLKCLNERENMNQKIRDILLKDSNSTHFFTEQKNYVTCSCGKNTFFTYNNQCPRCVFEQHQDIIEIIERESIKEIEKTINTLIEKDNQGKKFFTKYNNFKNCSCNSESLYFYNNKCPLCIISDGDPIIDIIEKEYKNNFLRTILKKDQCCKKLFKEHENKVTCSCGRNTCFTYNHKCAACVWENNPDVIDNIETEFMTTVNFDEFIYNI